jgi:hypothetical protein
LCPAQHVLHVSPYQHLPPLTPHNAHARPQTSCGPQMLVTARPTSLLAAAEQCVRHVYLDLLQLGQEPQYAPARLQAIYGHPMCARTAREAVAPATTSIAAFVLHVQLELTSLLLTKHRAQHVLPVTIARLPHLRSNA